MPISDLSISRPASDRAPNIMRGEARRFLRAIGASKEQIADIALAVSEAVANAYEHAYADGVGDVRMDMSYDAAGTVRIEISDTGTFVERLPSRERGRGLTIIERLAREVKICRDGGTRIAMYFDVSVS